MRDLASMRFQVNVLVDGIDMETCIVYAKTAERACAIIERKIIEEKLYNAKVVNATLL